MLTFIDTPHSNFQIVKYTKKNQIYYGLIKYSWHEKKFNVELLLSPLEGNTFFSLIKEDNVLKRIEFSKTKDNFFDLN